MASKDLRPILTGWPYTNGQITVRKILGRDGSIKIQMRLDLGVLQMNETGRPDGQRPHEVDSLLDYHLARLTGHEKRNGTELGVRMRPVGRCSASESASVHSSRGPHSPGRRRE